MKLRKIISGGQTGADTAGLEAALELGLETGGVAPSKFRTENGSAREYLSGMGLIDEGLTIAQRTKRNVKDADATVVFGILHSSGSALTIQMARTAKKPVLTNPTPLKLRLFLQETDIEVLNVAGNRLSGNPSIYELTYQTLIEAIRGG